MCFKSKKKENYMDIKVYDGDDGKQYVLYEDVLEILRRIKEAKEK